MTVALALLSTLAGIALLRAAWQLGRNGQRGRHQLARWGGWLLIGVAGALWASAVGIDRGIATAMLVAMLAGIVLVLHAGRQSRDSRRRRRAREPRDGNEVARDPGAHPLARRLWIGILAGPAAAAASLALGLVLWLVMETGGVHSANVLTSVVIFVPLAWAVLAIVATADLRLPARSAAVLVPLAIGALGSLALAGGVS
jgi:hypothetical protein